MGGSWYDLAATAVPDLVLPNSRSDSASTHLKQHILSSPARPNHNPRLTLLHDHLAILKPKIRNRPLRARRCSKRVNSRVPADIDDRLLRFRMTQPNREIHASGRPSGDPSVDITRKTTMRQRIALQEMRYTGRTASWNGGQGPRHDHLPTELSDRR